VRVLVLSDIHSNFPALQAVLQDAGAVDQTWCLGDLIGYGPDPNMVVEQVRELPRITCILGNHDAAILRQMEFQAFNSEARRSLTWTENVLTADNMAYLRSLPTQALVGGEVTLVHGSPRDPTWEYVLNTLSARLNFSHFDTPYCFVGHSHIQCMFSLDPSTDRVSMVMTHVGQAAALPPRTITNPGSVGQPRDRDPRAAYAIYDDDAKTWEARRVEYDISEVQQRIREAGLPIKHAVRLAEGW
jgi:diadenosine tetraphosphatase ApaH/serine/threonine PP2A family protein phosphatase